MMIVASISESDDHQIRSYKQKINDSDRGDETTEMTDVKYLELLID